MNLGKCQKRHNRFFRLCCSFFMTSSVSITSFLSVKAFSNQQLKREESVSLKANLKTQGDETKVLKLESTYNIRDLGGFKTTDGKTTKYFAFLRSDDTDELTENDIKTLKKYGVKTVIDMRDKSEVSEHPDKLNIPGIDYYHVDIKENYAKHYNRTDIHMSDGYIDFISYTDESWIADVFNIISNAQDGCILFHCVSGKDRTGLVAAFLLGLVNATEKDIVNDYSVSWDLVKDRPKIKEVYRLKSLKYDNYDFSIDASTPERIQEVIDYVKQNYDNFENYLLLCGVSQDKLNKIKVRFTE